MSAREIIEQLPSLTASELQEIEKRAAELISRGANLPALRAERIGGRLVFNGPEMVRQVDVDVILNEFP